MMLVDLHRGLSENYYIVRTPLVGITQSTNPSVIRVYYYHELAWWYFGKGYEIYPKKYKLWNNSDDLLANVLKRSGLLNVI